MAASAGGMAALLSEIRDGKFCCCEPSHHSSLAENGTFHNAFSKSRNIGVQ